MLKEAVRDGDYKVKRWHGVRATTMLLVAFADKTKLLALGKMCVITQPKKIIILQYMNSIVSEADEARITFLLSLSRPLRSPSSELNL